MLIACQACHRQYDVGAFKSGSHVRCACGAVCEVPKLEKRQVQMLHCATCGGALEKDADSCAYCEAVADEASLKSGNPCPECMRPLAEDARYCNHCGVGIDPESVLRAVSDHGCPRCRAALVVTESDESKFYQCVECEGIWLDRDQYSRYTSQREAEVTSATGLSESGQRIVKPVRKRGDSRAEAKGPNVRCPVCKRVMVRKLFAFYSGIYFDECKGHGFWFDKGELQQIGDLIQNGDMDEFRRLQKRSAAYKRKQRRKRRIAKARRERQLDSLGLIELVGMLAAGTMS